MRSSWPAELKVPDLGELPVGAVGEDELAAGVAVGRRHAPAAARVDDAPRRVHPPLLVAAVVAAEVHLHLQGLRCLKFCYVGLLNTDNEETIGCTTIFRFFVKICTHKWVYAVQRVAINFDYVGFTFLAVAAHVGAHVLVAQRPLVGEAEVLRVAEDAVARVLPQRVPAPVVRPVPLQVVEAYVLVLAVPERGQEINPSLSFTTCLDTSLKT